MNFIFDNEYVIWIWKFLYKVVIIQHGMELLDQCMRLELYSLREINEYFFNDDPLVATRCYVESPFTDENAIYFGGYCSKWIL